jgi:L-fuculokinase
MVFLIFMYSMGIVVLIVIHMTSGDSDLVMVLDCGSTNIKAVIVDSHGNILAYANRPNASHPQLDGAPNWLIWDLNEIWLKICEVSREAIGKVNSRKIRAVIVITWGADGAPIRRDGRLTYPPISWQCPRTRMIAERIEEKISAWEIFKITGYQVIPFNTLFKIIWLKENAPESLRDAYVWLMMPGLIAHKLTGEFHIDPTIASTMMAMDLKKRDWSPTMLELAGIDASFFPEWREAGEIIGHVTGDSGKKCGIPQGTPVITGGHDTQYAIFGSGAKHGEIVLSSGTWEILGARINSFNPTRRGYKEGLIIEADVEREYWNPQFLMIASAVIEWILQNLFHELGEKRYNAAIREMEEAQPGSNGLIFIPTFVKESGPLRKYGTLGTILGLTLQSSRAQILRAAFEGLTFQLKEALRIMAEILRVDAKAIRVVGGGSKNQVWNQMRADTLGLPVIVPMQRESATLGAALMAFVGVGYFRSIDEAWRNFSVEEETYSPVPEKMEIYNEAFKKYMETLESLKNLYAAYCKD